MSHHGSRRPLSGVDAKLARSREHLDSLKAELSAIYANPDTVGLKKRSDWEYAFEVSMPEVDRICAIAGDAIQNMRAALDYLVWDLVIAANGEPGNHTQFPIFKQRSDFLAQAMRGSKKNRARLDGMHPRSRALRLIVAVQPYHSPDPDYFWLAQLNRLANADKHHALYVLQHHVIAPDAIQQALEWSADATLVSIETIRPDDAIEDGTELLRLNFDPTGPPPEVHVKGQFPLTPVLGDEIIGVSFGAISTWLDWLGEYVDEFRPHVA